jgi:hypothetical protein
MDITRAVMGRLASTLSQRDPKDPLAERLRTRMAEVDAQYESKLEEIESAGRRTVKMRF